MTEINGCFFPNDRGPKYKGFIEIDGVRHQLTLWDRTSKKDGKPFLGVSKDEPRDGQRPQRQTQRRDDRDAPF